MASSTGKENIADGLIASSSFAKAPSLSPKKSSRKTRSKSIGPGGLGVLEEPALKESTGNRRMSAFIPAVKSILASNDEDEKKRREARRKSLAKRRVSFAPEATLHTWDVVEYLRDATTSSASSEATRRASNVSQASTRASPTPDSDPEESPSTPPEQVEEPETQLGSSPANQRDLHQKKHRRRSSGIPPMDFNNPDDVFSSSPLSGDSSSPDGSDDLSSPSDVDNETSKINSPSESHDSSESSSRLDAALRQATAHAGTQKLELDETGDISMELAEDEITAAFKPWAKRTTASTPKPPQNLPSCQDQENIGPFPPAPRPQVTFGAADSDDGEDMSMDITRSIGRIVPQAHSQNPEKDDMPIDLTQPIGSIQQSIAKEPETLRKSLKRRRSSLLNTSQGSPAKRPASRRTSLRQKKQFSEILSPDDQTMDLTVAIGGIKSNSPLEDRARRNSVDTSFGDETMDFTVAIGSIKQSAPAVNMTSNSDNDSDIDEDLSMEFTNVIGGIRSFSKQTTAPEKPTMGIESTPVKVRTATPQKSPRKSPGHPRPAEIKDFRTTPSPRKIAQATPRKSPGRPRKSPASGMPQIALPAQQIEQFEPSPFVRSALQSAPKPGEAVSTPTNGPQHNEPRHVPDDPIAAPILNRRRSSLSLVQFSPLAASREEPTLKSTALLSNNIKLLSTPRKQTLVSPMKRGFTPKKAQTPQKALTPMRKTPTPKKATPRKSLSPKKRVLFGEEPATNEPDIDEVVDEPGEEVERISLQEFLDMTKIRFMDLSTTKRRHTAAPQAFHDMEVHEKEDSLDRYVVAAACTLPEFELYQHACHEMKKYISDGRHFVRTMEGNVMEENPLLFSEYLTAPPDQRGIMDTQFKNLKTSARLEARGEWYGWRSTLLRDLKAGLLVTMEGFNRDESVLVEQEKLLDAVLPTLVQQHGQLDIECKQLQQRHDELNSCDREELEQTREQLVATDAELEEKRQLVARLQDELAEKEARINAVKERKIECIQEIKAAERVREECRGWSTSEVNDLKGKVIALEQAHGWSITSASSTTITMTYMNDLELYFQPSAFATGKNTLNASISLTYIGDSATPHPRPLTTSKRFFLQLVRAHLHCISQAQTRIGELLALVKNGWTTALAVAEGVRWLEHSCITEEFIMSDERMAISANMLLPALQTKVKVSFDIAVSLSIQGVETDVGTKAEVVYGEKYSEDKMGAFLRDFCGTEIKEEKDMMIWADAVLDLGGRLRATGRKGERA
ncbi:Spc7-domain-containing protein [Lindgomyces ingoldianus]|uniref:Spc7-domain-containing protein n=1 Tax=Lindgomyces ingoldianus TaxID=673940 RepID=A0ACB6RB50_9PLEO|nr:Spc7-domain-containing protein [Lindgomyces ingoldianus]KAF2476553.1 Spc7-domain-containing protein [Lindgomyces ingoldianus]